VAHWAIRVLLERNEQLALLETHLASARAGRGRVVLVPGEPGIGKTALLRAFCSRVRGARVLQGACDPLVTPRPLGPLLDIADRLGGALTELDPLSSRDRLFRAFLAELASRSWVTVAVIEDAHWADEASLDLLRYLARRIEDVPALLIVTFRQHEIGRDHPLIQLAGDLTSSGVVRQLELEPLSPAAVAELAARFDTSWDVEDLHRQTGGNPFFVTEALAAGSGEVPASVRDAILARMARLEGSPRAAAEAASVAPTRVEDRLLMRLADVTTADIDACVRAGVLAPDAPGTVAFRHELARRVVHDTLPPARRAALHDRIVDLLLQRGGSDPARVAHHAEQAGRDEVAFDQATAAAHLATVLGSPREAADQYERALRHRAGQPEGRIASVLEQACQVLLDADRVDAAVGAIDEAVGIRRRLGDPLRLGSALVTRNAAIWNAGRSQEAYADGLAAVALLEGLPPGEELAAAYAFVATDKMLARDHAGAAAWGERAVRLAQRVEAPKPLTRALNSMGAAKILAGDPSGAEDIRRSIAVAEAAGLDGHAGTAWINLGSAAGEIRDYGTAAEGLDRGVAHAEERDLDAIGHYGIAWLARIRFEQGEWEEAEALAEGLPLHAPGTTAITRITARTVLGRLAIRRGELAPGRAQLGLAEELARQTGDLQRLWPVAAGCAEAAWLDGDLGAVRGSVEETYGLACELRHAWAAGELGLWLWRAGGPPAPAWAARPYRLHTTGDWQQAADAWARIGCPYERGEALADAGGPEGLVLALATFDRLGAEPAAARARRALRQLGVRKVPQGPRRSTADHPAGLTRRQAQVLELVAHGRSDAEIAEQLSIAVKTAGHHVSAVLARLGAASRTEAAHRAHELGLIPGR
jgi:DNA-binding CsgD family transcriptional regulator/tetratricopeptide (TPR) repeat protein